jgi:hypothetical protein
MARTASPVRFAGDDSVVGVHGRDHHAVISRPGGVVVVVNSYVLLPAGGSVTHLAGSYKDI